MVCGVTTTSTSLSPVAVCLLLLSSALIAFVFVCCVVSRRNTDGLVYVVDSADAGRMEEASDELHRVLGDDLMRDVAILVYANKQDLPNAAAPKDIAKALKLDKERVRPWHVQASDATKGEGLLEGMEWLTSAIKQRSKTKAAAK